MLRADLRQRTNDPEAIALADAELSGIESGTLAQMGSELAGTSDAELQRRLRRGAGRVAGAGGTALQAQLEQNLGGREAAAALQTGGTRALLAHLEGDGGNLDEGERDRLIRGLRENRITRESIEDRAGRELSNREETVIGGGLSQLASRGGILGDVASSLQEWSRVGEGNVSDEAEPGAAGTGPMDFATAVTTFSTASQQLLEASENFSSASTLSNLGRVAAAGSPLTSPLGWLVPGLFGNGNGE